MGLVCTASDEPRTVRGAVRIVASHHGRATAMINRALCIVAAIIVTCGYAHAQELPPALPSNFSTRSPGIGFTSPSVGFSAPRVEFASPGLTEEGAGIGSQASGPALS